MLFKRPFFEGGKCLNPRMKTFIMVASKTFIKVLLPPLLLSSIFVFSFTFLPQVEGDYSFATYDKNGKLLCASLSSDQAYRLPIFDGISPVYKSSSIIYEDKSFYLHFGFDLPSIIRAFFLNVHEKRIVSGASTITMQTSRLLCGGQKRSYTQKIRESFYAFLLELKYSKEELFSIYASLAPFGGNVLGIEGATFRYFSLPQKELTTAQLAMLAVLPNQPSLVTLSKKRERLKEKRDALLRELLKYSFIDNETYLLSVDEMLPDKPHPLPFIAPHYHEMLKRKGEGIVAERDNIKEIGTGNFNKNSNRKKISTIDYDLQVLVEKMVEERSKILRENLVHNMAALVMDVKKGEVLAYVGNSGFFAQDGKNVYVDMIMARRSSGSLLKPFLYAGMLDRGMIFPSSLLKDVPTQINTYSPENNNGQYEGVIPANEALARSLNIPFVRSLREYGIPPFLKLLKECGFTTFDRTADEYGLPLILGGGELTLYEACNVYAKMMRCALGDLKSEDDFPLSQGASYLTLNALTNAKRGNDDATWEFFEAKQKIAWKSGTSDGFKDAWSVGVTPKYVVGVWAGNADGTGRPEIKSNIASIPLMFEIFSVLEKSEWLQIPEMSLKVAEVCSHSHYLKGRYCDESTEEKLPINAPLPKLCPYCAPFCLSEDGLYRVEPSDIKGIEKIENYFVLPSFEEFFYIKKHKAYRKLPPFLNKSKQKGDFEIIFPEHFAKITIPIELSGISGAFTAKVSHKNKDAKVYWDIDGSYLGVTMTFHQIDINVPKGRHILTVTDDAGDEQKRVFFVN